MAIEYEPFSPEVRKDPYPHYARLRAEAPVYWAREARAYVVSRYDDVSSVLTQPHLFSSDAMRTLFVGGRPGVDLASDPAAGTRMAAMVSRMPFSIVELATARSLVASDGPVHAELRRLVARAFTARNLRLWEGRVRELVGECMAKLRCESRFDLVADLAAPLPVMIIAEILGVEPERRAEFKRWTATLLSCTSGEALRSEHATSQLAQAMGDFSQYVLEMISARAAKPRDDLLSVLLEAEGTEPLTPVEIAMFVLLLLVAGSESTTHLIANAINALLDHPDQLELVLADGRLIGSVVEETLRHDPPVQFVFRRAACDVRISGIEIPTNSVVIPLIGSANRDERRWCEPHRFDVLRDPRGHLGFGLGPHFCLGAPLGRLQARIALEAMVEELPTLKRSGESAEFVDSFVVRGPRNLELFRVS